MFAASHSNYSVQSFMLLLLLSALYSVQLQLYNAYSIVKSSQVTFIYIALLTIQIVSKHFNSIKLEDRVSVMYNNKIKHSIFS